MTERMTQHQRFERIVELATSLDEDRCNTPFGLHDRRNQAEKWGGWLHELQGLTLDAIEENYMAIDGLTAELRGYAD